MFVVCLMLATWTCLPMPAGFSYALATQTVTWPGFSRHVDRVEADLRGTVSLDDPLIFRAGFE